ncbi:MAG: LPS export ABC transporter permease LptG [Gammaproteobacteria bacterium]|nr:LPS export ABC transporter permease LptG [Gammaproteobacteria bacterium]
MKILDFYIARAIIAGAMMALLVLTALEVFFALVNEFGDVGQGSYGYLDAVYYVALTLPTRFYELFPAAVLVGSLLSLGTLAANSELIAIRAAGISIKRIVRSAVQAGLVLLIIVALIGEFLVPSFERHAQAVDAKKQDLQVAQARGSGLWVRDEDYYINVGHIYPGLRLQDVNILQMSDDSKLVSSTYVASAIYSENQWELRDVQRTYFDQGRITNESKNVELQARLMDPELFAVLTVKPDMMSAWELHRYINYLERNKLGSAGYRLAFWLKVTTPISCVVMLLLVLPFVFSSLRSVSSGQLLVIGILLGLGFYILIQITARAGQIYGIPPFISATFPVLCFTMFGLFGLTKIR